MKFQSLDEIFAFLEHSRAKLKALTTDLNDVQINRRIAPDKWNIAEILEHLTLIEASILKLIKKLLTESEAQNPASAPNFPPVSFVEKAESVRGKKLAAPLFAVPSQNLTAAQSLEKLSQIRKEIISLRPRLEKIDLASVKFSHLYFGEMDLAHWTAFPAIHELHHISQINALLSAKDE